MLHRASNHSTKLDAFKVWQRRLDALYLPWLCPSLYGSIYPGSRRKSTAATARLVTGPWPCLSKPTKTLAQDSKRTRRGLASAVTASYDPPQDQYVPFEALDIKPPTKGDFDRRWLPPVTSPVTPSFDPDSALVINDDLTTRPQRFRALHANAISGEVAEIRQTVRACVQVDRLERAATLMRRLNEIYKPSASELIAAHNEYLRELVQKIRVSKDPRTLRRMQRWFEVDLRKFGVVPDAVTYALMIQAALQGSNPRRVDRGVKRYISLAREAGLRDDVMQLILLMSGEQDTGRITEIAPTQPIFTTLTPDRSEESADISGAISSTTSTVMSDIPKLNTTPTKGLGMATLKTALSSLSDQPLRLTENIEPSTEAENPQARAIMRQKQLEISTYDAAMERWRAEMKKLSSLGVNMALKNAPLSGLIWGWHEALSARIKQEISQANQAENANPKKPSDIERCHYGPFLQILPLEKLSAITILNSINFICMKRPTKAGLPIIGLLRNVGEAVEEESCAQTIHSEGDSKLWKSTDRDERIRKLSREIMRRRKPSASAKPFEQGASSSVERSEGLKWSAAIKVRIGAVLVSHLIQSARMEVSLEDPETGVEVRESQPAFIHQQRYVNGNRTGVIRFNNALAQKLAEQPVSCTFAKYLPMIVEPKPWVGYQNGAFLQHPSSVVRPSAGDYQAKRYAKCASENGDMDVVFSSLDTLARTPWRINRYLFEVMVDAWNSGEELGKIPPANPDLTYPKEPPPEEGIEARMKWLSEVRTLDSKQGGIHANRCFQNFQLEVARAYLDEVFYFPHNVDFRGRAYPMVPFFNHMAADPARSLLIFANGKELGERGLKWIKIHLASLYGLTKATFEDREKFTQDHLSEIFDSATRPLDGKRWWLQADDPWQCLATCIELRRALQSPDPHRFVSHLPVHQDGTCNGLQHYAALGGDKLGAKQVNLAPDDRPRDVYSTVADMVRAEIVSDAAQGDELAKLLAHSITRKVVKQTVMTNVYGVTFLGAVRQVRRQLEESGITFSSPKQMFLAATVVSQKIFKALSTMFHGATKIQHWLADCAGRISRAVTPDQIRLLRTPPANINKEDSPLALVALPGKKPEADGNDLFISTVIWTSPLKMPVVQPYRNHLRQLVETHLQRVNITSPSMMDTCHRRKQIQAFPPNFIHSLDATHMMLTALKCNEMGLTFAAVHDSFWTHARDVDTMNGILREAFVRMHSEDIIGRLRSEFMMRYKGCMQLLTIPHKCDTAKKIRQWRRKNKYEKVKGRNRKADELLLEVRRLELLGSANPEERLEGQTMMTPGSIYSESAEACHAGVLDEPHIEAVEDASIREGLAEQQNDDDFRMDDMTTLGVNETKDEVDQEPALKPTPEPTSKSTAKRKGTVAYAKEWLWVPLVFPPVPEKGGFDVSDVKQSKYFFC